MITEYSIDDIKKATAYLFTDSDLVLVELKTFRQGRKIIFRFLVDRSEGGITLGECAKLNQQIGEIFDKEQLSSDSYLLEVSSPGADRPLVSLEDFSRYLGRSVKVFLKEPVQEKRELSGNIERVEGESVILSVESEHIQIPIDNITKAKQTL